VNWKRKSLILLTAMFLLVGCSIPDTVTRNIRVIAQAEVGGKIVEGSAVMSIRWKSDGKEHGRMQRSSNTEAVILELNDKHTVYVLDANIYPDGEWNISYWSSYIGDALIGKKRGIKLSDFDLIESASGRFTVLASNSIRKTMPVMVSFEDETKRETMFHVTPGNFSRKFGANAKFVGLWFEFTDDPITEVIEERLPRMFTIKNNESYRKKFPTRDANGKRIPSSEYKFPQKFGKTAFKQKDF